MTHVEVRETVVSAHQKTNRHTCTPAMWRSISLKVRRSFATIFSTGSGERSGPSVSLNRYFLSDDEEAAGAAGAGVLGAAAAAGAAVELPPVPASVFGPAEPFAESPADFGFALP